MEQRVHYGSTMGAFNMHSQVECGVVYEVTPSLTDMRQFAPPISDIPSILLVQSIAVEYFEEYILVERMDSHVREWT